MNLLRDKKFLRFLIVFIGTFSVFYLASRFLRGLAIPGNYYSAFVDQYFDIAHFFKVILVKGAGLLLSLFNVENYDNKYVLRLPLGRGIIMSDSCIGFGVMSFWIAFVVASGNSVKHTLGWICLGLFLIYIINITRVALLLLAINRNWGIPIELDHHTWFNIAAYLLIFTMIYFFNKQTSNATRAYRV